MHKINDGLAKYFLRRKEQSLIKKQQRIEYQLNKKILSKERRKEKKKEYYERNKEKIKEYKKIYNFNNKENKKEYNKLYQQKRLKTDHLFKLSSRIRSLISISIKNQGYSKKTKTFEYLGCTFEEFKIHLEKKFTDGMDWSNYGKWHLDHIYPVSLANDEEHLIKLNHFTNFQPLWAIDNLIKSNKIM